MGRLFSFGFISFTILVGRLLSFFRFPFLCFFFLFLLLCFSFVFYNGRELQILFEFLTNVHIFNKCLRISKIIVFSIFFRILSFFPVLNFVQKLKRITFSMNVWEFKKWSYLSINCSEFQKMFAFSNFVKNSYNVCVSQKIPQNFKKSSSFQTLIRNSKNVLVF